MKRVATLAALAALSLAALAAQAKTDGTHLEIAAGVAPTFVQDPAYEAFSSDDLRASRVGGDLRVEALTSKIVRLVPFVGYRFAMDAGSPHGIMDTTLAAHDFAAGLRLRAWFRSWFGAFLQLEGGLTYLKMEGELLDMEAAGPGVRTTYADDETTWLAGGLVGLEFRLPPRLLAKRHVDWLGFGFEIAGGYLRRGDVRFEPTLGGGDEHSLAVSSAPDLGEINLSGWVVQIAFTVSLF